MPPKVERDHVVLVGEERSQQGPTKPVKENERFAVATEVPDCNPHAAAIDHKVRRYLTRA